MNMVYKLYLILRTCISYLCLGVVVLIFFLPCLCLIAILPQSMRCNNRLIFKLLQATYSGVVYSAFLPVNIKNKQGIPASPVIIVANHQSAFDIPIVGYLCGGHPHVWYVLDYYANKPILGFFVRRMGIIVTQDSGVKAARALLAGVKMALECNSHTILFPEGGRYTDGTIHPFLGGFALLAKKTNQPIVPVFIKNIGAILPPKCYVIQKILPIEVIVGPLYAYHAEEDETQFIQRVQDWFKQQL